MALATVQDILGDWPGWTPEFALATGDEIAGQGSGRVRVRNLRGALWRMRAVTHVLRPAAHRAWKARIMSLEVGGGLFYGYDLAGSWPILYPGGTWPTGASFDGVSAAIHTIDANNRAWKIDGLPAGTVISPGDYLGVTRAADGARLLFQAQESATADGDGLTPLFEVRPPLWPGIAVDDAVALKNPSCTMIIVPGSVTMPADPQTGLGTVSFEAVQAIEALS